MKGLAAPPNLPAGFLASAGFGFTSPYGSIVVTNEYTVPLVEADNDAATPLYRRPALLLAVAAGMCWASALGMLLAGLDQHAPVLSPVRLIFYTLVLAATLLTFVPIQRRLELPGLALEGCGGWFLLAYTVAFVPPPTESLLALPDTPVYLILIVALFWSVSAVALPLLYALGRRIFTQRARQYDQRRARRQAHEVGAFVALCVALAGLRALTPLAVVLVILILVVAELLLLSFIEAQV